MKDKLYKKVYIKSEADLPKVQDNYDCYTSGGTFIHTFYGEELTSKWWLSNVMWYLLPIKQRSRREELIDFMEHLIMEKYCLENPSNDIVNEYLKT